MDFRRATSLGLVAVATMAGCGSGHSTISVGADGLRTFTAVASIGGQTILCTAGGAIDPVTGTLSGRPGEPDSVWLTRDDGSRLSVIWPPGFTARFEPAAALYNDRHERVAKAGDHVLLGQVNVGSHTGAYEDPYIASGIVFDGCYPLQ